MEKEKNPAKENTMTKEGTQNVQVISMHPIFIDDQPNYIQNGGGLKLKSVVGAVKLKAFA